MLNQTDGRGFDGTSPHAALLAHWRRLVCKVGSGGQPGGVHVPRHGWPGRASPRPAYPPRHMATPVQCPRQPPVDVLPLVPVMATTGPHRGWAEKRRCQHAWWAAFRPDKAATSGTPSFRQARCPLSGPSASSKPSASTTGTRTGLKGRQHITLPIGGQTGPGDESITGLHTAAVTLQRAHAHRFQPPTPRPPKTVAAHGPASGQKQDCAVIRKTLGGFNHDLRLGTRVRCHPKCKQGLLHGFRLGTRAQPPNHRNTGRCWAHPASRPRQCVAGLWVPCP